MYQRILVGTAGFALSKKAVRNAIELATAIGADLMALYLAPRYPVSYFEGNFTLSHEDVLRIEKQGADKGQNVVAAVLQAARAEGVTAKAVVAPSDLVAEAIMAASRKHKRDLVVMASHGRKGIKRLLLGSETHQVLTHATIPVLVLR